MAQRPPLHRPQGYRLKREGGRGPRNPEVAKVHNSVRWQRLRAAKRASNPTCEDPFAMHESSGRVVLADQVHHIVPIARDPSRAFDMDNLMCVCRACHERLERGEQPKRVQEGGGGRKCS